MEGENRRKWLLERLRGIGASDAPVIMGKSLFKTRTQLWTEKVYHFIDDAVNEYILRQGHTVEAWARPLWEIECGRSFRPASCYHPNFSLFFASLDGWNPDERQVWECKLLAKEQYHLLYEEKIMPIRRVPRHYFDQLMHQFFVTGTETIYFTGVMREKVGERWKRSMRTIKIRRSPAIDAYIQQVLLPEELRFWRCVLQKQRPDKYHRVYDGKLKKMIARYGVTCQEARNLLKLAEDAANQIMGDVAKRLADIKQQIQEQVEKSTVEFEGIRIETIPGGKKVNWEEAFNALVRSIHKAKAVGTEAEFFRFFPDSPNMDKFSRRQPAQLSIKVPKQFSTKRETDLWEIVNKDGILNEFVNPISGMKLRGWRAMSTDDKIKRLEKLMRRTTNATHLYIVMDGIKRLRNLL